MVTKISVNDALKCTTGVHVIYISISAPFSTFGAWLCLMHSFWPVFRLVCQKKANSEFKSVEKAKENHSCFSQETMRIYRYTKRHMVRAIVTYVLKRHSILKINAICWLCSLVFVLMIANIMVVVSYLSSHCSGCYFILEKMTAMMRSVLKQHWILIIHFKSPDKFLHSFCTF